MSVNEVLCTFVLCYFICSSQGPSLEVVKSEETELRETEQLKGRTVYGVGGGVINWRKTVTRYKLPVIR